MRSRSLAVLASACALTFLAIPSCSSGDDAPGDDSVPGGARGAGASSGGGSSGSAGSGGGTEGSGPATGGSAGAGGTTGGAAGADGCGFQGKGTLLHVADNLELCLPPVVCTAETCPPPFGDCTTGSCVFKPGYLGLATLPEAWVTYYCTLSTGGCHGVTQIDFPEKTAAAIAQARSLPLCEDDPSAPTCVGIAASSPMVVGNSQVAKDSSGQTVANWGLGLTEASGLCCAGPMPNQPQVPGTSCCGNFGLSPAPDGSCS